MRYLWPEPICRNYLTSTYRHIISDNLEEDIPIAHDVISEWLTQCASALLIFDHEAGFRRFLGASPETAYDLRTQCDEIFRFDDSLVMGKTIQDLAVLLGSKISKNPVSKKIKVSSEGISFEYKRFFPAMLDWVCDQIQHLVLEMKVNPGEIAILSPFLSDALRFSLFSRLEAMQIPVRSHRPSRALRDEPVSHCLLNLAILAHPDWSQFNPNLKPNRFDIAYAFLQAFEGLDLIRAQLLVNEVFHIKEGMPVLESFDVIHPGKQARISYRIGEKYQMIRQWLLDYQSNPPLALDHFISRLFGEVLSQPGFGFHSNFQAGEISANLVESIQKFRWVAEGNFANLMKPLGLEYVEMVQEGVIAAQYLRSWETWPEGAVMIVPAYTFLMYNHPVDYQIWLDTGSRGWAERLFQPLTHPYILNRTWNPDQVWTDTNEVETNEEALYRLSKGLLQRCRRGIYLGLSDLGEQGFEQRGPLLHAFQRVLQDQNGF